MVTHSTKAASHAKRVLFIKDGEVFHQLYRGNMGNEELYAKISDTLTVLAAGEKSGMLGGMQENNWEFPDDRASQVGGEKS